MQIKKFIFFMLFLTSLAYGEDVYWYVAASMTEPAKIITDNFNGDKGRKFNIYVIAGGSGQLLSKIYASKTGDIYMPADKSYLDNALKLGVIKRYKPFLSQYPVIGLSKKADKSIKDIKDLCGKKIKIAFGNPKTMALGQIFQDMRYTIPEELYNCILLNKSVEAMDVQQIMNYIKLNVVDAGFIYKPMADNNNIRYLEFPDKWNIPSKIYFCELIYTKNEQYTKEAIDYIFKNLAIFEKYGFNVIK
jgi:molybdate transport system substrate-binding protein